MAQIQTPEDIISLLQDMELRSKQKAAGLSQEEGIGETWTAIGFRVGEDHFVIPLSDSREVFPLPVQVTPVPKSQAWVFGIVNLRGELLPVFDLNYYIHGKASKITKRSRVMVINHEDVSSGVLVDEVYGLKHFQRTPDAVDPSRPVNLTPYLTGSVLQFDTRWDVFSFNKLINDPRFLNAAA